MTAAPRKRPAEEAVAPHGLQTRHEIRAAKAQRKLQRRQRGGFGKHLESAGKSTKRAGSTVLSTCTIPLALESWMSLRSIASGTHD